MDDKNDDLYDLLLKKYRATAHILSAAVLASPSVYTV